MPALYDNFYAAKRLGAQLARDFAKTAEGEYEETISEHSPITHRVGQHALTGAAVGGGLGLIGALLGSSKKNPRRFLMPLTSAMAGAGLGLGSGTIHGAYDAGKTHALKRLENPEYNDYPTLRSGVAGGMLGPNAFLAMLASERGKVNALTDPNIGESIAALRRSRGGLW